MQAQARPLTGRSFYLGLMGTITVIVLYGFSNTVDVDIFHPALPQPAILYIHAVVYTSWLLILLLQTALIWMRNLRLHRKLGWYGAAFAAVMVVIGVMTTIMMGKVHVARLGVEQAMFIYRPLEDIVFFGAALGLAIHWRRRPDFHRRLMVLASCALTPPAISRIPVIHSLGMVYLVTDLLVMTAILYDLNTIRRVHAVYRWGLGIGVTGQAALLLVMSKQPAPFVAFARYVTQS
jgi:hypothetical protein